MNPRNLIGCGVGLLLLCGVLSVGALAVKQLSPILPLPRPTVSDAWVIVVEQDVPRKPASTRFMNDVALQDEIVAAGLRRPQWADIDICDTSWRRAAEKVEPDHDPVLLILSTTGKPLLCESLPDNRDDIKKAIEKATGVSWK